MRLFVASVWLIHGLVNKLLGGSARHLAIVQAVPGLAGRRGAWVVTTVGACEVAIAAWVLSRRAPRACAATQTAMLLGMNAMELTFARNLLLWPAGLVPINLLFLSVAWMVAGWRAPARARARLRRHPVAVRAHFDSCLAITFALPGAVLRPLLPDSLELETVNGDGFVAVALVQTRALRPEGMPAAIGQDFFLAGYRIFTRFRTREGRTMRGLRILRSDADRDLMVAAGNLLTHYHYHRCDAAIDRDGERLVAAVRTRDGHGDLEVEAQLDDERLPEGSPFPSVREARRFAGPLPFTFDYEEETNAIVAIEGRRANWQPRPVHVDVRRAAFFDQPAFRQSPPRLAAAFYVSNIDYRWSRGVRHAL